LSISNIQGDNWEVAKTEWLLLYNEGTKKRIERYSAEEIIFISIIVFQSYFLIKV